MNLNLCPQHQQSLVRELARRGLSEIGWCTASEPRDTLDAPMTSHQSQNHFNPFITAMMEIFMLAGDRLGEKAAGCPVCLLGNPHLIEETVERMTNILNRQSRSGDTINDMDKLVALIHLRDMLYFGVRPTVRQC